MGAAITVAAAEKTEEHKARGGAKDDESDPGKSLRAISKGFTVSRNIDSLMRELKAVPSVAVEASALDAREDLLTFRNGTVNLRTGVLREHSKADMLTYAQDMDYNPDAKCPRWEQFLAEIFPEYPELVDYFRRHHGFGR
jgi:putative DNA primase/helicase